MSTSSKKITLKSSDKETFKVDEVVARESLLIKNMIEYGCDCMDSAIPIPNMTSKILAKVIEYCEAWDASFVKVDHRTLFDLILAANFLNIKGLLDLTSQTVGDMMKGKTPEEIRKFFNIKN